jgi:HEAT repeat protein
MARLHVLAAALAAALFAAPCGAEEEVEIIAESAAVKVLDATIATVKRGERYRVVARKGPWTAIAVGEGADRKEGWLLSDKFRAVVDPLLTDDSIAPDAPSLVYAEADLVQIKSHNLTACLFFRLSLTNASDRALGLTIADLVARVGDKRLPYTRPLAEMFPLSVAMVPGEYPRTRVDSLLYFEDCVLRPNDTVTRWLSFDLSALRKNPRDWGALTDEHCILEGKLDDHRFTVDLTASESRVLAATARTSAIEPSVRVIEFNSEINLLNLGSVMALAEKIPLEDLGFVLLPVKTGCYFEYEAEQRWRAWIRRQRLEQTPPLVVQIPGVNAGWRLTFLSKAPSEAAAALTVLGRRKGSAPALIRHLHADAPETRVAAAAALGPHLAVPGVLTELLAAAKDPQPVVRAAALAALGDRKAEAPPEARKDDSADTAAILVAMDEPNAAVRSAAASAAGVFPSPRVRTALAALLDDKDQAVQLAACASLGELKAKEGVEKLNALRTSADRRLQAAALEALKGIGELSEVDVLLEKIKSGHANGGELQALAKTQAEAKVKDPRVLAALVAELNGPNRSMAAYSLAELGEREAVGPLIEALERTRGSEQTPIVITLGKLGDPRAIEPIREAYAFAGEGFRTRFNYIEALLRLKAPSAVEDAAKLLPIANSLPEKPFLLQALGRDGGEPAIAVIEPFLDDRETCRYAAYALALAESPKVLPVLEKRLLSADYAYGPKLLQGLDMKMKWFEDYPELLKKASDSPNAATQAAAKKLRAGEVLKVED